MTPPAATPRKTRSTRAKERRRTAKDRADGHVGASRSQPGARAPRRVSGPLRGGVRDARVTRQAARTSSSPRLPRRARTVAQPGAAARRRIVAVARSLPDHALLDRVIRGRAWIPLLGVMLAGIVAMQVEVLKLGANIGRSIERGSALQSRNDLLRESVASLADDQRIERLAAGMGMVMPAPTSVGFLSARGIDSQHAVPRIQPPDSSAFMTSLAALAAAAQQPQPATTAASPQPSQTVSAAAGAQSSTAPGTAAQSSTAPAAAAQSSTAPVPAVTPSSPASSSDGTSATTGG